MKVITAEEALKEHKALKSYWSLESRLTQKIMIALLSKIELMAQGYRPKEKRKPSTYNLWITKKAREGLSLNEAAKQWTALKGKTFWGKTRVRK
jgi:hypothetical protein